MEISTRSLNDTAEQTFLEMLQAVATVRSRFPDDVPRPDEDLTPELDEWGWLLMLVVSAIAAVVIVFSCAYGRYLKYRKEHGYASSLCGRETLHWTHKVELEEAGVVADVPGVGVAPEIELTIDRGAYFSCRLPVGTLLVSVFCWGAVFIPLVWTQYNECHGGYWSDLFPNSGGFDNKLCRNPSS
jgi:hypothetical protein